ncbi:MAG: cytochrome b/b6 domain-containing protein [Vitreoscilla sp.]|nr:cytochrome b/b6 domain-containing protein [Vitreoscilla sp.]MBP6676990.1 cytochrome b/b6 domain-containing protein [Vitreoscilla sp.]
MTDPATEPTATVRVRVWDLPTRAFHWALVLAVVSLVVTAELDALDWHMRIGLGVGALLVFRLVWGVVGGRWSRFASFVHRPGTILRYLRGQVQPGEHFDVGHNPLGALSVLALLALLGLQVASGLVADDEVATTGPLNRIVSSAVAGLATNWHAEAGKLILIVLVLLHVGAIAYYRRKKQINLVTPMITGDKQLPADTPASADTLATRLGAVVLLAACLALAAWVASLANP